MVLKRLLFAPQRWHFERLLWWAYNCSSWCGRTRRTRIKLWKCIVHPIRALDNACTMYFILQPPLTSLKPYVVGIKNNRLTKIIIVITYDVVLCMLSQNNDILAKRPVYSCLTFSHIYTHSDASAAEDDFWKHCGKWRNCPKLLSEIIHSFIEIFLTFV